MRTAQLLFLVGCLLSATGFAAEVADSDEPAWSVSPYLRPISESALHYCVSRSGKKKAERWAFVKECTDRGTDDRGICFEACGLLDQAIDVLQVDPWTRQIGVAARVPDRDNQSAGEKSKNPFHDPSGRSWECFKGWGGTDKRATSGYLICGSGLRKNVTGVGEAVIGNAFNLLFATTRARAAVDTDKVLNVAQTTGVLEMAAARKQEIDLHRYREAFANAETVSELENVIARYSKFDPDGLLWEAAAKLGEARFTATALALDQYRKEFADLQTSSDTDEFVERYSKNDPDLLVPRAKTAKAKFLRQESAARAKAAGESRERLAGFRRKLREGDDSHCGLVVEVKEAVVSVQTIEGLQWLKRSQMFPPGGASCRFYNGVYQN